MCQLLKIAGYLSERFGSNVTICTGSSNKAKGESSTGQIKAD